MRLHLRSRSARLVARPTTVNVLFDVIPGTNRVDVANNTAAYVPINTWAWSLEKGGVEVATSSQENPSFTSLTAGTDYELTLDATTIHGATGSHTFGPFTVDPGVLATPSAVVPGSVSGLTIPLTITVPTEPTKVLERRLYYKISAAPTTSDSFVALDNDDTSYDFVAASTGTWHFKLGDIAVVGLATDSALSADASAAISASGSAPSAPTLDAVDVVTSRRLDVEWTIGANIGDGNHNVYRVTGSDTGFTPDSTNLIASELSAGTSSYSDVSVAPETQYTYKVEAINSAGQAFSSGVVQTTPVAEDWPNNEPVGLTEIFSMNGSTASLGSQFTYTTKWLDANRVLPVSDAEAKYNSIALEKRTFIGDPSNFNGAAIWNNMPGEYSRMYFRMVFKLSDNWETHPASGTNKLWYFGLQQTAGASEFFVSAHGSAQPLKIHFRPQVGSNNGTHGAGGASWIYDGPGDIGYGVYHTVEFYIVAQSAPGVSDGSFQMWVNGVEKTSFNRGATTGLQWLSASATNVNLDGFQGFLFWGGSGDTKTVDDNLRISEFYVSGEAA